MSIGCAALMCHAPIVVPPIAGSRANECATTTRAMDEVARTIVAHEPRLVVLVSPHAPRKPGSWGIAHTEALSGSFARFGHGELEYGFESDPVAAAELDRQARALGLHTHEIAGQSLDHGALVPLHFLSAAGYHGPVLLVALPFPYTDTEREFGEAIAAASRGLAQRWAVLASGDMSHRLTKDAPAGFEPRARNFDATFVAHLRRGDVAAAVNIDAELADLAAEDVLQSTTVALGAVGEPRGTRVIAYEGPFGVGYCEALLHSDRAQSAAGSTKDRVPSAALLHIAHDAIAAELTGQSYKPRPLPAPWDAPRPVFVTLRSPSGELRGCIGRVEPVQTSLAEEVADCAISAATRDYRMPRVDASELRDLHIEVSLLCAPETVSDVSQLDPRHYGVIVSKGAKRGVLLPNVEGIDTPDQQVQIALRKGGISAHDGYRLQRFTVLKAEERHEGMD